MNTSTQPTSGLSTHELRFRCLFDGGRGLSFPCDRVGTVDLDTLSECARNNYLFARTVIGRDFAAPQVRACEKH